MSRIAKRSDGLEERLKALNEQHERQKLKLSKRGGGDGKVRNRLFQVNYKSYQTDDVRADTCIIYAANKMDATRKFNKEAATKRDYPYMWTDAISVEEINPW